MQKENTRLANLFNELPIISGFIWSLFLGKIGIPCRISPRAQFSGKLRNIHIGAFSRILPKAFLSCDNQASIYVGKYCEIHPYARLMTYGGEIKIGDFCSVNPYAILYGHGGLYIGSRVRIASHVVMIPANHGIDRLDIPIMDQDIENLPITIHDNVWIGTGAKILGGVIICSGAVIGAGAVVTRDVPENAVVAGVPAKVLYFRGGIKDTLIK
jgi:acetyltransferase-like isoleucine patch superfamily enzyme